MFFNLVVEFSATSRASVLSRCDSKNYFLADIKENTNNVDAIFDKPNEIKSPIKKGSKPVSPVMSQTGSIAVDEEEKQQAMQD